MSNKGKTFPFKKRKNNTYDLSGEYGIGYTTKGEEFYFDLEDYNKIKNYYWHIDTNGYVVCNNEQRKIIYMHRFILNMLNSKLDIDHIYHQKNDNRKSKLRICEHKENCRNVSIASNNSTGVTGVSIRKENCKKKYRAIIGVNGKDIKLGSYEKFEDAIKARKEAEEKYFGEFSYDNSVGGEKI